MCVCVCVGVCVGVCVCVCVCVCVFVCVCVCVCLFLWVVGFCCYCFVFVCLLLFFLFLFFEVQIRTSGLHRAIHFQTGVSNSPWTAKDRLSLSVGIVPVQQMLGSSAKLLDWLIAWQNGAGYLLLTARENSWHG